MVKYNITWQSQENFLYLLLDGDN